ncbi:hypothetical protein ABW19_dt0210562 [Dactylella cylindrospora]|nr:hypothetical protein ABW19_dt0210562 [Dactylella cylindrospora]
MPLMSNRKTKSETEDSSDEDMQEEVEEKNVDEDEDEDQDAEDEDGGAGGNAEPEEYIVEKIMGHKFEDGVLKYLVKWQGYEKKSDQTWEPEDTLEDVAALDMYLEERGGRPTQTPGKRGRKSAGAASTPVPKKNRIKQEGASTHLKPDEWDPPSGSWEDDILMIETLERSGTELICYVQWVNGRKSQHPAHVVYQRCPQKMLKFYESHLWVFQTSVRLLIADANDLLRVFRDSAGTM